MLESNPSAEIPSGWPPATPGAFLFWERRKKRSPLSQKSCALVSEKVPSNMPMLTTTIVPIASAAAANAVPYADPSANPATMIAGLITQIVLAGLALFGLLKK